MLQAMRRLLARIPFLNILVSLAKTAPANNEPTFVPPGHFYSPIPAQSDVRLRETKLWPGPESSRHPKGIDWNESHQLELLETFRQYYPELPFPEHKTEGFRFWFENPAYSYSDAIFLYCFIRHLQPKHIIEVGAGHSSSLMLDVNSSYFAGKTSLTFIEPYPDLLMSLIRPEDSAGITIIPERLQDVDLNIFSQLTSGDILFIDSSHVAKVGSDVNKLFFEILPDLSKGVHVHLHDVFYNFEYPKEWIFEGRAWNEIYILRAFLQYNQALKIEFCNTFLEVYHEQTVRQHFPLCFKNPGGSIWLSKTT